MLEDTQRSLTPHQLHDQVQEDEGSSPPHPGTAVDQEGCGQRGGVLLADTTDERDEGHGVVRYSMVRPGCVQHALENFRRHIITEKVFLLHAFPLMFYKMDVQQHNIRASVDALCRDEQGQISRDPRTKGF